MKVQCVFAVGSDTKPEIMFYTNQTKNSGGTSTVVVGLEGQTVSLRCFFSGRFESNSSVLLHACRETYLLLISEECKHVFRLLVISPVMTCKTS